MKVYVISKEFFSPYYGESKTIIHSVVDSEEKARQFIKDNSPTYSASGGVSFRYVEMEVK